MAARALTVARVVLSQLIILAALVGFLLTFTVGPVPPDTTCLNSHPRITLQLVSDAKAGATYGFGVEVVCDLYQPPPPPDTTPAVPYGWVPWSP